MNIGIVKVLVQAFVDEFNLLQLPSTADEKFSEIYGAAQDEENQEIIEILDWLDNSGNSEILFRDDN